MHLSELEKKIRHVNDEIVKIKEDLDTNVYQAESLFIRRVECKPKEDAVAKAMSELKSDKGIETYSFEPETKMKEMLTSSVKLGIIKITSVKKAENKPTTGAESSVKTVYHRPGTVAYISNV
jgi:formamidopyrimidine-DNA glycosylase